MCFSRASSNFSPYSTSEFLPRTARGNYFARYLCSTLRWWSRSNCHLNSEAWCHLSILLVQHVLETVLIFEGILRANSEKSSGWALANISSVKATPSLSFTRRTLVWAPALIQSISLVCTYTWAWNLSFFSATSKTHLYHCTACCLLFPVTMEYQSQEINYCWRLNPQIVQLTPQCLFGW